MAGEVQRVFQRKQDLLVVAERYGVRGSVGDDDAPSAEKLEKMLIRAAARLTLARIEALLARGD
jgi:hypothetical protein